MQEINTLLITDIKLSRTAVRKIDFCNKRIVCGLRSYKINTLLTTDIKLSRTAVRKIDFCNKRIVCGLRADQ